MRKDLARHRKTHGRATTNALPPLCSLYDCAAMLPLIDNAGVTDRFVSQRVTVCAWEFAVVLHHATSVLSYKAELVWTTSDRDSEVFGCRIDS